MHRYLHFTDVTDVHAFKILDVVDVVFHWNRVFMDVAAIKCLYFPKNP